MKPLLISLFLIVSSCAAKTPEENWFSEAPLSEYADKMEQAQFACVERTLAKIKDLVDPKFAAPLLSTLCQPEYDAFTDAFCASLPSESQKKMYREWRNKLETRIQTFTLKH